MKLKTLLLILAAGILVATFAPPFKAIALSGSEFKPGRIIDDIIFTNKDSMTIQQIQDFLDAKVPICNRNHTSNNPSYQPPYTCLKEYQENTATGESNIGRFDANGAPYQVAGGKTAAQIIWEAGQKYNINPQSLIVLLQKEQGLITDDWPWLIQYQKATGYLCPDTAPCDPAKAGFYRQLDGAAWQFRNDLDGIDTPDFWAPFGKGLNNIPLNPDAACGTKSVNIENQATAVLYKYTPYTPNDAALNNLYGTGDGCSAYGNRNFWRMFNDWFGSTIGANYSWQYAGQGAYTDNTKVTEANITNLAPNTRYYLTLKAKNTGNRTWNKGMVNVATSGPGERNSAFYDSTWLWNSRAATLIEDQVAPGATGTFGFWIKTPATAKLYNEYFNLVAEGVTWMNSQGLYWPLTVRPANYSWQYAGQGAYTDNTKVTEANITNLAPNTRYYLTLKAKNTGNRTWNKGMVNVATSGPGERNSAFYDSTWLWNSRAATLIEDQVAPGATGTFGFWIKTPATAKLYNEYFNLVAEGVTWMNSQGLYWPLTVRPANYSWQYAGQGAYTDNTKVTEANITNLAPNTRYYLTLKAKNTGNRTWNKGMVNVATSGPGERNSAFYDSTWLWNSRAATLIEDQVAPGATGTFGFWIKTPATAKLYNEYFNLVAEGVTWMNSQGLYWPLTVFTN